LSFLSFLSFLSDLAVSEVALATAFFLSSAILLPPYFVSLWRVCFLQNLQYFFISNLSGLFFFSFIVL
jgi:hypothetical protein